MAVSTLDPKTALTVIDLQNGILALPTAHPVDEVVKHVSPLADAFRGHGLPVVLVTVGGAPSGRTAKARSGGQLPAGWAALVPELNQQPEDHRVTKRQWGAFTNTRLEEHRKILCVTQVVIAVDAMTDTNPDAHINRITRIFPRLGETGTTEEIIALLVGTRA